MKRGLSRRQLPGGTGALAAGAEHGQIRVHRKPKPLPKGAVTHDWGALLGPAHNAVSMETMLSRELPPSLAWEFAKGTGYASPAVAGERLVFLHRLRNEEIVEGLHPETASSQWQFRYATAFEDRYGHNNGPRSSPVIDGERVYTAGAGERFTHPCRSRSRTYPRNIEGDRLDDSEGTAERPIDLDCHVLR